MFDVKVALSDAGSKPGSRERQSANLFIRTQEALTSRLINFALSRLYRRV